MFIEKQELQRQADWDMIIDSLLLVLIFFECFTYNRNRMSENSVLELPQQFQPYQIVLLWMGTIYASLFVMVSNHFVFKPKVEHFFEGSAIHSTALYQFLVDVLTNLTHLTFLLCSLVFLQDDNSLSVMLYSDISWASLFLCLIAFKGIAAKDEPNFTLLLLKNVIFLGLSYVVIGGHYALDFYVISLGLLLVFFYGVNLIINAYEDKFVAGMELLFGYKPTGEIEEDYLHTNNMPSLDYLSTRFKVGKSEIQEHMRCQYPKLKNIQLKTRKTMAENLLKISLAVYLSKQKMETKARRDVKYYYGTFNGTVVDKSKKMIFDKQGSKEEESSQVDLTEQHTQQDPETHNSALFYLFPVKFLEGNQVISLLFSIAINLGLGVLLSVTLKMTETIQYGQYFQLLFGVVLIPILPSISKQEFLNSMVLSSLWKYCLYGMFLSIVCLTSDGSTTFAFVPNLQLLFTPFIQLMVLVIASFLVCSRSTSPYSFSFLWLGALLSVATLIFKYC